MEDDLIGDWRAELIGVDLLELGPVDDRFRLEICLRADRTVSWRTGMPNSPNAAEESRAPFPITWEISSDRVLSIFVPIPPMPQYELPDWSRDAIRYDLLSVTDTSLAISNRRFHGEDVIILRRMNAEEYRRKQVEQYREALSRMKDLLPPGF